MNKQDTVETINRVQEIIKKFEADKIAPEKAEVIDVCDHLFRQIETGTENVLTDIDDGIYDQKKVQKTICDIALIMASFRGTWKYFEGQKIVDTNDYADNFAARIITMNPLVSKMLEWLKK